MMTHDRYQTAVYVGLLGVWTVAVVESEAVIRTLYRPHSATPPAGYNPATAVGPAAYLPGSATPPAFYRPENASTPAS